MLFSILRPPPFYLSNATTNTAISSTTTTTTIPTTPTTPSTSTSTNNKTDSEALEASSKLFYVTEALEASR